LNQVLNEKYVRANALPVSVRCPICSELRIIDFEKSDLDIPAFVESLKQQPWTYHFGDCRELMIAHAKEFEEYFALSAACQREEPWAIEHVRQLIQNS